MSLQNKIVKNSVYTESPHLIKMSTDECKRLCDESFYTYHDGDENRIIERIVTTEAVDRDGDIIRAKGIDNSQFRMEPVVLYAHDRYNLPVARSIKEKMDGKNKLWRSWDLYFNEEIDTTGRSDLVFRFINAGAMRGGSIGFLSLETRYDHTDTEREEMGLGKWGAEFIRILKLEHSACSIPANQEALAAGLKALNRKTIENNIHKSDLDILEKHELLDGNLIDVFYKVLGVEKTISIPEINNVVKSETPNQIFNISIPVESLNKSLETINTEIIKLNESISTINESYESKLDNLITSTEKLLTVFEHKNSEDSLYDIKDIEDTLKLNG